MSKSKRKPGRPKLPEGKKATDVRLSLYPEDHAALERLSIMLDTSRSRAAALAIAAMLGKASNKRG